MGTLPQTLQAMCGTSLRRCCRHVLTKYKQTRVTRVPPGPVGLPIVGSLLSLDLSHMPQECTRLSRQYGKLYRLVMAGKQVVVVSDARLLNKLFDSGDISRHTNDRSENITKHVFYGRKHIGFANLSRETVALRTILRKDVLQHLLNSARFEHQCATAIDNLVNNLQTDSVQSDNFIQDFLTQLNGLVVGRL